MGAETSGTAGVPTVLDEGIVVVVRFLVRLVLLDIRLLNQLLLFLKGISPVDPFSLRSTEPGSIARCSIYVGRLGSPSNLLLGSSDGLLSSG